MFDRAPLPTQFRDKPTRGLRIATCLFTAILCPIFSLGCLSLSVGNWTTKAEDPSVLTQSGSARVTKGQIADIFYPVPYASAPNVELNDLFHNYEIVEQKADHFRVRNLNGTWDVQWTARGIRAGQPAIVIQPTTVSSNAANP